MTDLHTLKATQPRRYAIYQAVLAYADAHNGLTPTYREIAAAVGCAISAAYFHVQCLIKAGLLAKKDGRITIPGAEWYHPHLETPPDPRYTDEVAQAIRTHLEAAVAEACARGEAPPGYVIGPGSLVKGAVARDDD